MIIHINANNLRTSIEFETIIGQQQPDINNHAPNELLITIVIVLLAILDAGTDARS